MSNSLFSGDKDWQADSCLHLSLDTMSFYIEGYREAADKLVHDVIESGTNQDILVFPISSLYRQYIELQLKHIIRESRIFLEEGANFPDHHKLHILWNTANALMDKIIEDYGQHLENHISNDDIQAIKMIITEFIKIDPNSFSFRYPKNKKGNSNLEGIEFINIKKLHDQMQILKEKLERYYLCLSLLGDLPDDIKSEHGSGYGPEYWPEIA